MPSSLPESLEPEHAIEQSNLALCVISGQGELRYRDPPIVVKQKKGGCLVFVSFVALAEEAFQIFVRNYGPYDASADLSASGESLGKWLVARGTKAWHNIASDTLFKFQESYDRQSKVFEPTTIEVQFRHLSKVEGLDRDHLVPVIVRQPSPEDGPGYVMQGDDVMQRPGSVASVSSSDSDSASSASSGSISQMSDDELQEALTEHRESRLLLPARLTPGLCGKIPVEDFCRQYELPEEIQAVLTQMKIKDAHNLSRVYLRELRDHGLVRRSIDMLRLAVIRFSSESRP